MPRALLRRCRRCSCTRAMMAKARSNCAFLAADLLTALFQGRMPSVASRTTAATSRDFDVVIETWIHDTGHHRPWKAAGEASQRFFQLGGTEIPIPGPPCTIADTEGRPDIVILTDNAMQRSQWTETTPGEFNANMIERLRRANGVKVEPRADLSAYELQRLETIKNNEAMLATLGIQEQRQEIRGAGQAEAAKKKKRKRPKKPDPARRAPSQRAEARKKRDYTGATNGQDDESEEPMQEQADDEYDGGTEDSEHSEDEEGGGSGSRARGAAQPSTSSDDDAEHAKQKAEPLSPSSKYAGVSWAKQKRRWKAQIYHEGRTQTLGRFAEEAAAARAFDAAARRLRGEKAHNGSNGYGTVWLLNFPTAAETAAAGEAAVVVDEAVVDAAEAAVAQRRAAKQPASPYAGVGWDKRRRRWKAQIQHKGEKQHLGYHVEEAAAARAFDEAARRLRGDAAHGGRAEGGGHTWRLNFPTEAESAAFGAE